MIKSENTQEPLFKSFVGYNKRNRFQDNTLKC